jgi:hypothetical protein
MPIYAYRPAVLEHLSAHGVAPRPTSPPQLVRDFLSGLYRYELRVLKGRLLRKEFARAEYAQRVIEVRRRYVLLSVPIETWAEARDERPAPPGE